MGLAFQLNRHVRQLKALLKRGEQPVQHELCRETSPRKKIA